MPDPADPADPLADTADLIAQLVKPYTNIELTREWTKSRNPKVRRHITEHPSLLDQLVAAAVPGRHGDDAGPAGGKPGSRPPANLDAIDRYAAIAAEARDWFGHVAPGRTRPFDLEEMILALVGHTAGHPLIVQRALLKAVRRWHTWARTVAGWERPPWQPSARCPQCNELPGPARGLRVRLDSSTACCLSCGSAWDATTVGILAEHIQLTQRSGGPQVCAESV